MNTLQENPIKINEKFGIKKPLPDRGSGLLISLSIIFYALVRDDSFHNLSSQEPGGEGVYRLSWRDHAWAAREASSRSLAESRV